MGIWERIEENKKESRKERIRGFMPFVEDANVTGTLESVNIKDTGKGFYVIRAANPCTVSVKDEDSSTGLGIAQIGELVGVRKCGATKVLSRIDLGTLVSITYIDMRDKEGYDPVSKMLVTNKAHHITVDVYKEEEAV